MLKQVSKIVARNGEVLSSGRNPNQAVFIGFAIIITMALMVGIGTTAQANNIQDTNAVTRSYDEYLDPVLPKDWSDILLKAYEGERYEAEVPDTLDLAENARECVNYLTRLAPDEKDGWAIHIIQFGYNPAILYGGGGQWKTPFFAECIPLMRAMSGSKQNLERDRNLIGPLVFTTGRDGLCYMEVENHPWAVMDRVTRKAGRPFADMMNQSFQLNAYAMWYQHDQNPLWKNLALRKINRMLELAVPKDNDDGSLYFRMTRGYSPWYKETGKGQLVALGDGDVVYKTMEGTPAGYTLAWTPEASAVWFDMTGHEPAKKLATGTARYIYEDKEFYDPNTQIFKILKEGHPTVFTYCLNAVLANALVFNNREMIQWAERGLNQWLDWRDPNRTGIVMATEACQLSDMVQVALMLSRSGVGDYWEIAERIMRNSISSMQITEEDLKPFKNQPICRAGDPNNTKTFIPVGEFTPRSLSLPLPLGYIQPDDATDRCRGAWFASLDSRAASIGCCNGHVPLSVYMTWDSTIEAQNDQLKVNLLMNRASSWADIDSYLPNEGKVVIKMKTDQKELLVRIPQWVDRAQISCTLTRKDPWGATRSGQLPVKFSDKHKNYLDLGSVLSGDEIVVEFPMKEYVLTGGLHPRTVGTHTYATEVKQYQITYRGNTVIDIDKDSGYPLWTHDKYRSKQAQMHKVERFVYPHSFDHWGLVNKP